MNRSTAKCIISIILMVLQTTERKSWKLNVSVAAHSQVSQITLQQWRTLLHFIYFGEITTNQMITPSEIHFHQHRDISREDSALEHFYVYSDLLHVPNENKMWCLLIWLSFLKHATLIFPAIFFGKKIMMIIYYYHHHHHHHINIIVIVYFHFFWGYFI